MQLELWAIERCQSWCVLERSLSIAGVEMRRVVSVSNAAAVTARVPPAALQMKRETIMPYILLGILKIQAQEMGNEVKNWSTKMVHLDVLFAHGSEAPVQSAVTTEMTEVSPTMSPSHRTTQWAGSCYAGHLKINILYQFNIFRKHCKPTSGFFGGFNFHECKSASQLLYIS